MPQPYVDELIGSVFIRACRRLGVSSKHLMQLLFEARRHYVPMSMSSGIARVASCSGIDPNHYLSKHTVFRYAVAFMPTQEALRLHHNAILSNQPMHLGAVSQSGNTGNKLLRYCKACLCEDMVMYGESYWHRAHNLPITYICTRHMLPLYESPLPSQKIQTGTMLLPHEVTGKIISGKLTSEVSREIASISVDLLRRETLIEKNWIAEYRVQALNRGYVKAENLIASKPLARDLRNFYGPHLLQLVGCDFDTESAHAWPTLITRQKSCIPYVTVKHLLMQTFLKFNHANPEEFKYKLPGPKPAIFKK